MRTIDLRDLHTTRAELRRLLPRAAMSAAAARQQVLPLIAAVQEQGEQALREQAQRFDGVTGHALRVPVKDIQASLESCPVEVSNALTHIISRLRLASAAQVPEETLTRLGEHEATVRQRWVPVSRVGVYAPGGKAAYPSSVLMNVVAAQTAQVREIALASPAQRNNQGRPHEAVLWAAALAGVNEVYAIGGAAAIAAFAYGVPEIELEAVDVVTGPGNAFVAAAKRQVAGLVGIDSEAGTTEILIIADASADAEFVAADLLSQAEHDEAAASVLVTDSESFAREVANALERRVTGTRHEIRARTALTGQQSAVILVDDLDAAVRVSNAYAPEHLELQVSSAHLDRVLQGIEHAGAVFLGGYTPVSLGDYLAGSNHVLPTGGTARFSAGLGAHTFLRPQQVIEYSRQALAEVHQPLLTIAAAEGLPAHGEAVSARFTEAG